MSSSAICLENVSVDFDNRFTLHNINWQIDSDQNWVIVGANGAGKSALAAVLAGAGQVKSGHINGLPSRVGLVSLEAQAELIAQELKKDDADIMDVISQGTPVNEILCRVCTNKTLQDFLVDKFSIEHLLSRAFRKLSTGETRKVMLVRALASDPELLILDEPFEGLDARSSKVLKKHLSSLVGSVPMVLVLNRWDEHPEFVSNFAYVENAELKFRISRHQEGGDSEYQNLYQLLHLKTTELKLPSADGVSAVPELNPEQPLVRLTDAKISYTDTEIFSGVNWTIHARQHWQLTGPNGSGKTGLLSLITGDHPQCYTNDIWVFGFQRGSGESVWQIKQYIGYVSTALQWQYRVSASVRNVIISGFYDSIGVYTKSTDAEREIANQWLAILGMQDRADQPFAKLSFGDQRMLLIARAMVKNPPLLILDEPCVGLDDMNRQLVLALIEKICVDSQSSVIYVSHHAEDQIKGIDNYLALDS